SLHIGTAFNRILKDFIIKYFTMSGYDAPFIPGWDCHGMPIEHKVVRELGHKAEKISKEELRQKCKEFASKFVNIQLNECKRLGTFGDWEHPYLTMDPKYEAKVIDTFKGLVAKGFVYRDRRPVHWCTSCKTALAEAELEYKDIPSPSIYVRFPIKNQHKQSFLIWTTTPWTLPANVAVALHPDFKYDFVRLKDETLIIVDSLRDRVLRKLGIKEYEITKTVRGKDLEGLDCEHPIFSKTSKVIIADFVKEESGTGCVHIAPGHGYEDYQIGTKYGLPLISPVDEEGVFTDGAGRFAGKHVFDADPHIVEFLKNRGLLIHYENAPHSYPHCWRCGNPLIFRAAPQWFLNIEHKDLRKRCIAAIERVEWIPSWSKERILHMVVDRPDWCLSRQRAWGIPIPAIYCKSCGTPILDLSIIEKAKSIIEKEGAEAWFKHDVNDFNKEPCPQCGKSEFIKEKDIFDVWFDSSSSYNGVVKESLRFPADLYFEAVDQHRGWFQHSLILSMVTEGEAAFKSVLTHGLILDKKFRKMSKSLGNVVSPMDVVKDYGADILRLYFSSLDYTKDIPFDPETLNSVALTYRHIRNTFKFLLGNLYDFDPKRNSITYEKLPEIDKFMLHRLQVLIQKILKAYPKFEFYKIYHSFQNFCTVELSKFYLDILKDRLYTYGKDSLDRRSAQTVLYEILDSLARLIAPIMPFTAEEVWQHFRGKDRVNNSSVHLAHMPQIREEYIDEELARRWESLIDLRDDALLALERARKAKLIGNSLEAKLILWTDDDIVRQLISRYLNDLPYIFIVSSVAIGDKDEGVRGKKLSVRVERAPGRKCERCWIYSTTVGNSDEFPTLCAKCVEVMKWIEQNSSTSKSS
ncbi:MAG TPA: isoleucine--tRNA ligase, partial [bacterium (Candidatus Stahlbacteria)]|nr:isoleucine--tRNA ligase [Candidatus Stahlbacteria bacterium]